MILGEITTVDIVGARVEATDNTGGDQTVTITIVDEDGEDNQVLHTFTETVLQKMIDDWDGTDVDAIRYGLTKPFNSSEGRIASKANGRVIGPDGSSGEQNAEIAYTVAISGTDPESPSVAATGPLYTKPSPVIGTTPIPICFA